MDLSNLLECGIIFHGPKPSDFIPKISDSLMKRALKDKFKHIENNFPDWSKRDFWNQMYITVQLCRIIYSLKTKNFVISKKESTRWCIKNVPPEFKSIIKKAQKGIDDWEKPLNKEMTEKLPKFLNYVENLFLNFSVIFSKTQN